MIVAHFHKKLWSAKGDMNLVAKLNLESGAFVTLYGPSGAGKTSILRMLAGLMTPDAGNVSAFGEPWFDAEQKLDLAPQKRRVGFLFQDYALFPNMTIRQNLEYAMTKGQSDSVMEELMDIMDLSNMADRKPGMLSGGQQQRVALARALVAQPQVLLLDEPLSALDSDMRLRLQSYILEAHQRFGLTTLMVSHDVGEVLKMSDQVIILNDGQITEQGTPADVFAKNDISGKFQFTGEVIQISQQDVVFVITVLIGKELVKVVADESDITDLDIGDKVLVASKAFNPIIQKI